jgi:gentisate 1,2-dioxygenase
MATSPELLSLDDLYEAIEPLNLTPGWIEREQPIMGSKERSEFLPGLWKYAEARAALESAGDLIDVKLAERRNLILRNPQPEARWATSRTLVCAYQMILPGESAPSHRHTSNALRVIIEGEGAYSIVDGVKMPMNAGDVVLTPGGHYHGHGHDGNGPSYWLDCLDVPLTYLLEPMYFQPHPEHFEAVASSTDVSPFRFSKDSIERLLDQSPKDRENRFGSAAILLTPSMPTIGLTVQRLETGLAYRRHRSSANRVFSVISGRGSSMVDGVQFSWTRGDSFVVPSSYWVQHSGVDDSVLIEMSDEPLMRFANHYFGELG